MLLFFGGEPISRGVGVRDEGLVKSPAVLEGDLVQDLMSRIPPRVPFRHHDCMEIPRSEIAN